MSRIGNSPIPIPSGVDVSVSDTTVTVKGPKGELVRTLPDPITASVDDGVLRVQRPDDERASRARHGLARALLNNMVIGVTDGYTKDLEIHGVGYRAQPKGASSLELQLGFSHPVTVDAPEGISFEVPQPTEIIVVGIDKEIVGQVAADIRAIRPPEPYKGKGIRYRDERVRRKAGKAAVGS